MNLTGRGPMGQKKPKPAKKPRKGIKQVSAKRAAHKASQAGQDGIAHMGKVKRLPCAVCVSMGRVQRSPTEVHHVKSGRYGSARESDMRVLPICHSHHNKLRPYPGDEDVIGFHNAQATWEAMHGPDHGFLDWVADQVAMLD